MNNNVRDGFRIAIPVLLAAVTACGKGYFKDKAAYWQIVLLGLFAAGAIWALLIALRHRVPSFLMLAKVSFTHDFTKYCRKCASMVENATGTILTVQTPYDVYGDHQNAFNDYLTRTVERLVRCDKRGDCVIKDYRRLVVVDEESVESEIVKLEVFLNALFAKWNAATTSYANVTLYIANRSLVAKYFYTNLDLHIMSDQNYALAFQSLDANGKCKWDSSVHVRKAHHKNYGTLVSSFNTICNSVNHSIVVQQAYNTNNLQEGKNRIYELMRQAASNQ